MFALQPKQLPTYWRRCAIKSDWLPYLRFGFCLWFWRTGDAEEWPKQSQLWPAVVFWSAEEQPVPHYLHQNPRGAEELHHTRQVCFHKGFLKLIFITAWLIRFASLCHSLILHLSNLLILVPPPPPLSSVFCHPHLPFLSSFCFFHLDVLYKCLFILYYSTNWVGFSSFGQFIEAMSIKQLLKLQLMLIIV